jgi:hypothetical protein
MSQQNQFSPTQIHKRTATIKVNLRTRLLRVCVFVYELKKSQPEVILRFLRPIHGLYFIASGSRLLLLGIIPPYLGEHRASTSGTLSGALAASA